MLQKQNLLAIARAPDKVRIFISKMPISSSNPMFDHLLESSHRDDSNKWSNIGFSEEITQVESIEVPFMHLIWSSGTYSFFLSISQISQDDVAYYVKHISKYIVHVYQQSAFTKLKL